MIVALRQQFAISPESCRNSLFCPGFGGHFSILPDILADFPGFGILRSDTPCRPGIVLKAAVSLHIKRIFTSAFVREPTDVIAAERTVDSVSAGCWNRR